MSFPRSTRDARGDMLLQHRKPTFLQEMILGILSIECGRMAVVRSIDLEPPWRQRR